jgi:hypothetical protein
VTITLTRWVIHLLLIFYFMITTYACVQALISVFCFAFNIVEFSRYVSSLPFFGLSTRVLQWPCWRVAPSMPLQCLSNSKSLMYVYCCDERASEWVSHFLIFYCFVTMMMPGGTEVTGGDWWVRVQWRWRKLMEITCQWVSSTWNNPCHFKIDMLCSGTRNCSWLSIFSLCETVV